MTDPMVPPGAPPPPPPPVDFNAAYQSYDVRFPEQRPAPSQAMAGWALGLAIVPGNHILFWVFKPLSVIFAVIVLVRCRDGRNHGKKKAIAALVIVGLWAALIATAVAVGFAFFLNSDVDRDEDGNATGTGTTSVSKLRKGDCLRDEASEGEAFAVTVTPCGEPHHGQVYAEFELPDGGYPGFDEATELADRGCTKRITDIKRRLISRRADVFYLYPQSSAQYGLDATMSCIYQDPTEFTGSILRTP